MQVQAKNIEVGMTVKYGNEWVNVENVTVFTQKNGKQAVNISGMTEAAVIRRRSGWGKHTQKVEAMQIDNVIFRAETKVNIK